MEYAIQLLVPLLLGLWGGQALAQWLAAHQGGRYDWITIVGCLLGFSMGLAMMYQRLVMFGEKTSPSKTLHPRPPKEEKGSDDVN
ncbi:MAG: AtpZ/AtpI family protein [Vampirovibrionales bacterium]|nr:AtpZ/AtpI family protein [Vampirovibrionales bacterium]